MLSYDAIIIGAGPAGLMAARQLKDKGKNFLLIDSKKKIGYPLCCGEGIRKKGFQELFSKTSYPFIKNNTHYAEVVLDDLTRSFKAGYLILDRPKFEGWLSIPIKENIKLGEECIDIIRDNSGVTIKTTKSEYRASIVILANGCNYSFQKRFGMLKKQPLLIPCYGGIFKNHSLDTDKIYFYFDQDIGSALWVFPKDKGYANAGIAQYHSNCINIKDAFQLLQKKNGLKLSGKPSFAGIFPSSGPIDKTYSDRIIACGDAAGQVYAGTGEGIYYSLKCGKVAGMTAAKAIKEKRYDEDFLKTYEKEWKKAIGNDMKTGIFFMKGIEFGFRKKLLKKIFALPKEKELHNMFLDGRLSIRARVAMRALNML